MTQKRLFITGAGKGIGREIALLFAKGGWTIGATDISEKDLTDLRATLGDNHFYQAMDVTQPDQVSAALEAFAAEHGNAIDLMINNAGIADIADFEKVPLARHHAVVNINVNGVLNCAHLALPYLIRSQDAVMINMCSLSSTYGVPSEATYSSTKFFVKGFTEALNIEWERYGIYVCDVMPNFVATPMMENCHGNIVDSVGINLTPADVARVVWQAATQHGKVHWTVDTLVSGIKLAVMRNAPARVRRAMMKNACGY